MVEYFEKTFPKNIENWDAEQIALHATAQSLHAQVIRKFTQVKDEDIPLQIAWKNIKSFYNEQFRNPHTQLSETDAMLHPGADERAALKYGGSVADHFHWRDAMKKWGRCRIILEERLIQNIKKVFKIISGPYAVESEKGISNRGMIIIKDVIENDKDNIMNRLNDYLCRFGKEPPQILSREWKHYKDIRDELHHLLISPPYPENNNGAKLFQFIEDYPCDLNIVIREEITKILNNEKHHHWNPDENIIFHPCEADPWVFCHKDIISDVITEAFDNACKVHRPPGCPIPLKIEISVQEHNESQNTTTIQLIMRNAGTDPDYRPKDRGGRGGDGTRRLSEKLTPYEAELWHGKPNINGWDYELKVTFKR